MAFIACVLVSASIGVLFKLFPRWRVNTFNAIVVNYTLCLALGVALDPTVRWPFEAGVRQAPWFTLDLLVGVLFITGFNLTALAVRQAGMTLTTLMQKMSILLTVAFTLLLFGEPAGTAKITGLAVALVAIFLVNRPRPGMLATMQRRQLIELFLVWLIAAGVEMVLYVADRTGIVGERHMAFTTHGFGVAGIIGWTIILFRLAGGQPLPSRRDVLGGLLLGAPNFFSIYLLLHMLNEGWAGSIMYPLVNVTVLVLSALIALLAFRERLSRVNWVGIGLAILAIGLIAWSENTAG